MLRCCETLTSLQTSEKLMDFFQKRVLKVGTDSEPGAAKNYVKCLLKLKGSGSSCFTGLAICIESMSLGHPKGYSKGEHEDQGQSVRCTLWSLYADDDIEDGLKFTFPQKEPAQ